MTTRVAIVGGTGKLGTIVRQIVEQSDDFVLDAVLGSTDSLDGMNDADLVVDTSTPAVSMDVVRHAIAAGKNVLIGTSGWSAERISLIRAQVDAAGVGVVVVPNFSLGSVVGSALAAIAAPLFSSIEIVETHRETKIDSPSGTAVRTAELISAARSEPVEAPYADQRARGQQVASVPIHSLRRPGVVARQEVILSGPGESLSIVHDTIDPALAYAPGITLALQAARDARGVHVGLDNFLDIGIRTPGAPRESAVAAEDGVPGQVARATGA